MLFLGLDLSPTASGVILINENYERVKETVLSTPKIGVERLYFLENQFKNFIKDYIKDIKLVCVESPAYGVSEGNLVLIGQWLGIVELNLFKSNLDFIPAAPSQVKKYLLGIGRGEKNLMLLKAYKTYGEEFDSDDICDAYVLARIARDYYFSFILKDDTQYKKFEKEVLDKIRKSILLSMSGTTI
jgi:Holliday junction resolvasome RuvABC endonuclease subunit